MANLQSIVKYGLLSNERYASLEDQSVPRIQNDYQSTTTTGYISCSIGFPNYSLFYKFRQDDASVPWCVIRISPDILHEKDCLFCVTNSTTGRGNSERRNALDDAVKRNANSTNPLKDLFLDYEEGGEEVKRSGLGIPAHYPTNPQAEILVPHQIEWSYVSKVYLKSGSDSATVAPSDRQEFNLHVKDEFFSYRSDWEHWRAFKENMGGTTNG